VIRYNVSIMPLHWAIYSGPCSLPSGKKGIFLYILSVAEPQTNLEVVLVTLYTQQKRLDLLA
jgi:hypothetical protein